MRVRLLSILLLASAWSALPSTGLAPPVVSVTGGSIQGAFHASLPGGAVFKGIPFAQPPVKDLRWREPQPVQAWKGVRDATRPGPSCIQHPLGSGRFLKPLAQFYGVVYNPVPLAISEDCLYLNVWTPDWPVKNPTAVMVWIHGGSNVIGSGSESGYDGSALARKGVVVVTINYRLGVFGFFAHPELTRESPHHASGNYGLLDQIAALEWVRQNIASFGGDPRRVTVFGESAGSIDAGLLLGSPLAAGLFQRAIFESGPVLSLAHPAPLETGERFGEEVARSLGSPGNLRKLRESSPEGILSASREVAARMGDPGFVLDGWCLRESPAKIFAQAREMPVHLMIGNNGREMSVFHPPAGTGGDRSGVGGDSVKQTIRTFYGGSTPIVAGLFMVDSMLRRTEAADAWINDVICACPAMAISTLHAATGHRAYVYQFLRSVPGKGQKILGSFHSLELPYVFGTFRQPDWNWLPFEQMDFALGESMRSYWTNFAKSGNPNGPQLPNWPSFDTRTESAMEFGKQGSVAAREHARPTFCDLDVTALKARLNDPALQGAPSRGTAR